MIAQVKEWVSESPRVVKRIGPAVYRGRVRGLKSFSMQEINERWLSWSKTDAGMEYARRRGI